MWVSPTSEVCTGSSGCELTSEAGEAPWGFYNAKILPFDTLHERCHAHAIISSGP